MYVNQKEEENMKQDETGLLVSEIYQDGVPANLGDSMANTARMIHLAQLHMPSEDYRGAVKLLKQFRTEKGYVRHPSPNLPVEWRENDTSSDQMLPWYIITKSVAPELASEMRQRVKASYFRSGNGGIVAPVFFAILIDSKILLNIFLSLQVVLFKVPWRWNDEKKSLEKSEGSTCDYLNWFHASRLASPWVQRLISKETLNKKILSYYETEPNSEWLTEVYSEVILETK
jgi:hypothetical protein